MEDKKALFPATSKMKWIFRISSILGLNLLWGGLVGLISAPFVGPAGGVMAAVGLLSLAVGAGMFALGLKAENTDEDEGSEALADTKKKDLETVSGKETSFHTLPQSPNAGEKRTHQETALNPDDKYKPPHQLLQRPAPPNPINTIPVYDPKRFVPFDEDIKSVAATESDSAEEAGDSPDASRVDLVDGLSEERAEPKQKPAVGENVQPSAPAVEGQRKLRSRYEPVRDPKLREAAIRIHGRDCCVCGFNFDDFFGEQLGSGYVEMHHLKTIAAGERLTDPATDLAPLCANCHAMADRLARIMKPPPDTIDSLKLVRNRHAKHPLNGLAGVMAVPQGWGHEQAIHRSAPSRPQARAARPAGSASARV